jgi:hypothetical protein
MPEALRGAAIGAKESGMFKPSPHHRQAADVAHGGRVLTVVELTVVLEELDRVVAELEESLSEFALPLDEASRRAAREAIDAARWH